MKGQLPKAYLRIDPNLDMTHPDLGSFVKLLCAANRQPKRGRFKTRELAERALGKKRVASLLARRDLVKVKGGHGQLEVDGWDIWQEGDVTVGDRMRRYREKHSGAERTAAWRLRNQVFERDSYTCRYCAAADYPREFLVAEHVMPATKGGKTDIENLVTACRPCNYRKRDRTPEEAGMQLLPPAPRDASRDASHRNAPSEALGRKGVRALGRQAEGKTGPVNAGGAGDPVDSESPPGPNGDGPPARPPASRTVTEFGITYDPDDPDQVDLVERCGRIAALQDTKARDVLRDTSQTRRDGAAIADGCLIGISRQWLAATRAVCARVEAELLEDGDDGGRGG